MIFKFKNKFRKCLNCGKRYEVQSAGQKSCSKECSVQRTTMLQKERRYRVSGFRRGMEAICTTCKKTYRRVSYNQLCCSEKCRRKKRWLEYHKPKKSEPELYFPLFKTTKPPQVPLTEVEERYLKKEPEMCNLKDDKIHIPNLKIFEIMWEDKTVQAVKNVVAKWPPITQCVTKNKKHCIL